MVLAVARDVWSTERLRQRCLDSHVTLMLVTMKLRSSVGNWVVTLMELGE